MSPAMKLILPCLALLSFIACGGEAVDAEDEPEIGTPEIGAAEQALFGSDSCKKVEITIENKHDTRIKVYSVDYQVDGEDWRTEGLENQVLAKTDKLTWFDQNLAGAKDERINKWKVNYSDKEEDGDFSDMFERLVDTSPATCKENSKFLLVVE